MQHPEMPNPYPYPCPNLQFLTLAAAKLTATELGLGTAIHAFHIPLGGHVLSVNQGLFLSSVAGRSPNRWQAARNTLEVSGVTATLKSLAPAGNTLGPMFSILMQGALYSLGIVSLGRGQVGRALAMALLCLWGFIQPMISLGLIFGPELFRDMSRLFAPLSWKVTLMIVAGIKITVGICAQIALGKKPFELKSGNPWIGKASPWKSKRSREVGFRAVVRDMTQPLFLFSIGIVVSVSLLNRSSYAHLGWVLMRPIGGGFLFFLLMRSPQFQKAIQKVCMKSAYGSRLHQLAVESLELSAYSSKRSCSCASRDLVSRDVESQKSP